ncbi:porin [Massilia sp. Root335]|uniref:porin n=1 Tax=Massilia sp. Root335 TaxID=1736517 RepID=UPI0006F3697E|nr:porin [Massilia sp. Root335]KQV49016.1 porin [Massilia sp. Root335]
MKHRYIVGACALGLSATFAQAQSFVKIYGVADAGIVLERGGPAGSTENVSSGVASGSRLGFKGKEDLGDGTSAFFVLENGINMDTGTAGQGGRLFGRQALVGLTGAAGSVSLGRQYAPYYKVVRDVVDPFCTGLAGNAQNLFPTFTRVDNSVEYQTPKWHGVSADVLYGVGEAAADATKNRTIGASVGYDAGPLTLVLVHHQQGDPTGTAHSRNTMLAGRYRFGVVTAHAAYARNRDVLGNASRDALLGLAVKAGAGRVLASLVVHRDDFGREAHARQAAIGYEYSLSRHTDLYAAYGHIVNRDGAAYTVGNATDAGAGTTGINLGVRHVF